MINVLSRVFPSSTAQSYLIFSVNISGVILTTASNPLHMYCSCTYPQVHIFVFFYYFVVITNIIITNYVITTKIYLLLLLLLSFWPVVLFLALYRSVQFLFLFFTQIWNFSCLWKFHNKFGNFNCWIPSSMIYYNLGFHFSSTHLCCEFLYAIFIK